MQKQEELMKRLKQARIHVSDEKMKMLISFGKEIQNQKPEMINPTLNLEIKRLGAVYFGKEIDSTVSNEFVVQINKKRGKISIQELTFVFQEIIDNKTDAEKYFKLSEVLRIVDEYLGLKARVSTINYQLNEDFKKEQSSHEQYDQFQKEAMRKHANKEDLSIYEMAAVGKRFEFEIRDTDKIRERAQNDLENEIEKNNQRHKSERNGLFVDPSMKIPILWTEELLYRFYLYMAL